MILMPLEMSTSRRMPSMMFQSPPASPAPMRGMWTVADCSSAASATFSSAEKRAPYLRRGPRAAFPKPCCATKLTSERSARTLKKWVFPNFRFCRP